MAKKEVKALPSKVKHIVTEAGKGLIIFCEEGKIVLNDETPQKALKYVYEEVLHGTTYVQIVSA